jgi:hypothetical protein
MLRSTFCLTHRYSALVLTAVPMMIGLIVEAQPLHAQSLQEMIDQASPGDTVLVPPGDYARPVTMHKDITLLAEGGGVARLSGLTGSLGSVVGIKFDGNLQAIPGELATVGSGLLVKNCTFTGAIRGARMVSGAEDVHIRGCTFDGVLDAIYIDEGVLGVRVENSMFTNFTIGISGSDSLECPPGGNRQAANRCPGGNCGRVEIAGVTMNGGGWHITLAGDYVVYITGSRLWFATDIGIRAAGVRLEITDSEVVGTGGIGTGIELASVSGFIQSTRIQSWNRGVLVGDGGCSRYSDLTMGGELQNACDISNYTLNLALDQPEAVETELNFWGTTTCESVHDQIIGQRVSTITNAGHSAVIPCLDTPVEPITWGRLKTRYEGVRKP